MSRLEEMLEGLLALPGRKPVAPTQPSLPVAFGLFLSTAALPPGWLERVLARIADGAAQGASPKQVGVVIAMLRPASVDGLALARTVLAYALAHADSIPLASLYAWLCGTANLADRVTMPPDAATRLVLLGPMVLAAKPPLAPAVAAAVAMALFTPVAVPALADDPPRQMQEVLTQMATLVAAQGEAPPAATLTALAMGLARSLILVGWQPPSTLAAALSSVDGLAPATRASLELGVDLARHPARCLEEPADGLDWSDAERLDCLDAACFTRTFLIVSTSDNRLDAIRALALPPAHDAVRHTLIDRVTSGQPLPKSEQGLADLHRRKLAGLATRRPEASTPPIAGKSPGQGDGKREVGGEEQVLEVAQAGMAEAGRALDMMDFYDAFRSAFPIYALLRHTLEPARRTTDLRELTRAQTIIEGFLADIDGMAGAIAPGMAASLRAHVQDMNDTLAAGLQALTGAGEAMGKPAPKESKTKAGAS